MSIFLPGILAVTGIAAMTAALDRGDLDETARQGALAGPHVIATALHSHARAEQLAGILGATAVEDGAELLPDLAEVAGSADRRVAIPAARAAHDIAERLARRGRPDDLAPEDLGEWRAAWAALGGDAQRSVEVRTLALDTAAALVRAGASGDPIGFDLAALAVDRDPDVRLVAVTLVPAPVPAAARPVLAKVVADDADARVALAAAGVLCGDLVADAPAPVVGALGARGLDRIKSLVAGKGALVRAARRCLQ